jgi:hypothetical protein
MRMRFRNMLRVKASAPCNVEDDAEPGRITIHAESPDCTDRHGAGDGPASLRGQPHRRDCLESRRGVCAQRERRTREVRRAVRQACAGRRHSLGVRCVRARRLQHSLSRRQGGRVPGQTSAGEFRAGHLAGRGARGLLLDVEQQVGEPGADRRLGFSARTDTVAADAHADRNTAAEALRRRAR